MPPLRSTATSTPRSPGSSSSTPSRTRPRGPSASPGAPAALGDRLHGIRLDTPSERGRVTADLVLEVRARLDLAGHRDVKIVASGGLPPDRLRSFKEAGAPVDSFAVGSYISGATPIDFTADLKEIDGRPIAKRGRIPGRTASPRPRRGGPDPSRPAADREGAYELFQRGVALMRGRHHAQAAVVLERAARA